MAAMNQHGERYLHLKINSSQSTLQRENSLSDQCHLRQTFWGTFMELNFSHLRNW